MEPELLKELATEEVSAMIFENKSSETDLTPFSI